jgi:hypothetical protein
MLSVTAKSAAYVAVMYWLYVPPEMRRQHWGRLVLFAIKLNRNAAEWHGSRVIRLENAYRREFSP